MLRFAMAFLLATLAAAPVFAQLLGTGITYQGRIKLSGAPLNNTADFEFRLFKQAAGGTQQGATVPINNLAVTDGLFSVSLDFGASVYTDEERWLQISVRSPAGAGAFTTLTPRQLLTAVPFALSVPGIDGYSLDASDGSPLNALFVDNAGNVGIGTTSPVQKLSVVGTVQSTSGGFMFPDGTLQATAATGGAGYWTASGAHIYKNNPGNVGIGTTTPNAALHVKGNGNILSLEGTDHLLMGFYPDGVAAGRKGYLGYVSPSNNDIHLVSEAVNSSLVFIPGTSGNISVGNAAIPAPLVFPNVMGNKISLWGGTSSDHYGLGIQSGALQIYSNGPGANVSFGHGSSTNFVEHMRIAGNGRVGIGTTSPQQMLDVNGTARVGVLEITGADLAEKFPTSDKVEPGMVVAIDPANAGKLCLARGEYNRCVAGVVSGANNFSVGAVLGNLPGHEDAPPIALSGRVYVWCDASSGAIQPGDLLTTSDAPGHAMKAADRERSQGAVIGKAMERLESGRGLVLVLVNLQ